MPSEILMPETLCERCRERAATVFITKIVGNEAARHRLCAVCAQRAADAKGADGVLNVVPSAPNPAVPGALLEELVRSLLKQDPNATAPDAELPGLVQSFQAGEFTADEDALDDLEDLEALLDTIANVQNSDGTNGSSKINGSDAGNDSAESSNNDDSGDTDDEPDDAESRDAGIFAEAEMDSADAPSNPLASANPLAFGDGGMRRASDNFASERCPKCGTTWDRLRQDGRAGCSHCYVAFATQLAQVMERVQRASQHAGKAPRAMEKRQRRLLHLRARRDHRLEMLHRRLKESVARENYEEAARLRDKIKIVTSTIVEP